MIYFIQAGDGGPIKIGWTTNVLYRLTKEHPVALVPLKLRTNHWRSRWLVTPRWGALHRVAKIAWEDGEKIYGEGVTVCGIHTRLHMPGIFSRMGLKRCKACCRALGLPQGDGAPFNNKDLPKRLKAA